MRRRTQNIFGVSFLCLVWCLLAVTARAQVVPDGTTDTQVSVDGSGHVIVEIAPDNDDRVSHNNYRDFNVPEAGLDFDNRIVGARTIVNEVTSTNPSLIQGAVEVLGQRAHVILANPNGITVDGGEFINTGGVALSTGDLSYVTRQVAPGVTQDNPFLTVTQGMIRIEGEGLVGVMDNVDLLAKELFIDGQLVNNNDDPASSVALIAGANRAEYDVSVIPTNNLSAWSQKSAGLEDGLVHSQDALLIDITRDANIQSASVLVEVSDLGAGVRYAGDGLASRRDFVINADGHINFDGAQITAATDVIVEGAGVRVAGDILDPEAVRRAQLNASNGAVLVHARTGDIELTDAQIAGVRQTNHALMQGGVTLLATGAITADAVSEEDATQIFTYSPGDTGFADDVVLGAGTNIALANTDVSATGSILVNSPQILSWNEGRGSAAGVIDLSSDEDIRIDGVEAFAAQGMIIDAASIQLGEENSITTLSSYANISLTATDGDIAASGAQIRVAQASNADPSSALPILNLNASRDIALMTTGQERMGIFEADGGLNLIAGGEVLNHAARFVSDHAIMIEAGSGLIARIDYPDGSNEAQITNRSGDAGDWWSDFLGGSSKVTHMDYGSALSRNELAYISAGTDITIDVPLLTVIGAEISAVGGNVAIDAQDITIEGVMSGSYTYRRSCFLFCQADGESNVNVLGGRITASGDIAINNAQTLSIDGGEIFAQQDVFIDADQINLYGTIIPTVNRRPSGLYNFWSGTTAWVVWRELFGSIHSLNTLTIDSDNPVMIDGGVLTADTIINPAGVNIVRPPNFISPIDSTNLGWFGRGGWLND